MSATSLLPPSKVYVPEPEAAWARATVLHAAGGTVYEVRIDGIDDYDEEGQSNRGAGEVRTVDAAGMTDDGRGNLGLPSPLPLLHPSHRFRSTIFPTSIFLAASRASRGCPSELGAIDV